jgi:anti-anti-sigma regulatory factor
LFERVVTAILPSYRHLHAACSSRRPQKQTVLLEQSRGAEGSMTLALHTASRQFTVTTTRCDHVRAHLQVRGEADVAGAEILQAILDGHLRAGRRFLRVDMGGATTVDDAALQVLSEAHHSLLAARGTLIITAVSRTLLPILAKVDSSLLVLPVNVADVAEARGRP